MTSRDEALREVRRRLTPDRLVTGLSLQRGAKRQPGGWLVLCPAHSDSTPSCSITLGDDETTRVRCFGCDLAGDERAVKRAARRARAAVRDLRQGGCVGCGDERRLIARATRKAAPSWRAHRALDGLIWRLALRGPFWRDPLCDITVDAVEMYHGHEDEGLVEAAPEKRAPWRITSEGPVLVGAKARRVRA